MSPRGIYERTKRSGAVKEKDLTIKQEIAQTNDELAVLEIAEVIHEFICSIPGCVPKFHREDGLRVFQKLQARGLINTER